MIYACLVLAMIFLENKLIFFPIAYPQGDWQIPSGTGPERDRQPRFEDCFFQAADGTRLHGWFCRSDPARDATAGEPSANKTLLWFHGNAGNVTHRRPMVEALLRLPISIFIIDYRGYGRSGGSPSEAGIYQDAGAAWEYLVRGRGIPPERIVLFGKSLGTAPAVELATRVHPAGLIIQSAFTSVPDMAAIHFPFIPRPLIRTRLDSLSRVGGLTCPKLFIHSPEDEIVPYALGRRLFEAAAEPKEFFEVRGAQHNDTWLVGGTAYLDAIGRFIAALP